MKEKTFEAKFCGAIDVVCPFVKAAFKGKDGNAYIGIMLIDTGSNDCLLNKSILPLMDDSIVKIKEGKSQKISGLNKEGCICQEAEFKFKMGNEVFTETFYVGDVINFDHVVNNFIGIIGNRFLTEHELTLDYSTRSLYSSKEFSGDPLDYEFFFPMEFGMKQYGLPVVGLICNDMDLVMLVDSGANKTILTEHAMKEAGISADATGEKESILGFDNKSVEATIAEANLSLLSIGGTEEEPKICNYKDSIQVIHKYKYIMDNLKDHDGEEIMPISGMLSSRFMHDHKWVLDFSHWIMYTSNNPSDSL